MLLVGRLGPVIGVGRWVMAMQQSDSRAPLFEVDAASGELRAVRQIASPNRDARPVGVEPDLIVVHGISLPPGEFGGPWIERLFTGTLPPEAHPYFADVASLRVSAHLVVSRDGSVTQYVKFGDRAWHAGQSRFEGREACNDFSIGPDKALYISDTANSKIYKLPAGAASAELFLEDRALYGIDGITFLNGTLYVNNVFSNNLYRIPVDAAGKAGPPVDIWMDQPIKGPDGMRAVNGKLLVAENGSGKIDVITVNGVKATVTVI